MSQQDCTPSGGSRGGSVSLPLLVWRGHPRPLARDLLLHLQSQQQHSIFSSLTPAPAFTPSPSDPDPIASFFWKLLGFHWAHPGNPGQSHLKTLLSYKVHRSRGLGCEPGARGHYSAYPSGLSPFIQVWSVWQCWSQHSLGYILIIEDCIIQCFSLHFLERKAILKCKIKCVGLQIPCR